MSQPNKKIKVTVIGDAHVELHQSLRRFVWLGHHLNESPPDYLVWIGDFLTLESLSAWDKDKRLLMEGRRYQQEIQAGVLALNATEIFQGKHKWKTIFLEGNHENRLTRYIEKNAELENALDVRKDLGIDARGYKWIPYKSYWELQGVHFTHIPFGKMREITGKDICSKAEAVTTTSVVFGHTHELHTSCVHKHGMKHLQQILNVGCFFEQNADYIQGKMTNYWKGIVELDIYDFGRFDIKTISMGNLERVYGKKKVSI
jgi:predicted phosphodiesterase